VFGSIGGPEVILLFIAALLSKTVVATLPASILVILWWKRGKLALSDLWRTLPFFAMSLVAWQLTQLSSPSNNRPPGRKTRSAASNVACRPSASMATSTPLPSVIRMISATVSPLVKSTT
jgi:hypothetical protein